MAEKLKIGELAEKAGVTPRTIRYYEELNLIRPDSHNERGFRLYSENSLARLEFIRHLKMLDFSLDEIRDIILRIDSVHTGSELSAILGPLLNVQSSKTKRKIACYSQMKEDIITYYNAVKPK